MRIEDGVVRSKKFCVDELREWYKKAEEGGFIDIELFNGVDLEPLLHLSTKGTIVAAPLLEESEEYGIHLDPYGKAHYYEAASNLNHIKMDDGYNVFESYEDQQIWRLHSEGVTHEEISKVMNRGKGTISRRLSKYKPLLTNKLHLPSVKEVNTSDQVHLSEDAEYQVVDYCKDPLKTTEDVMIDKIDRDRVGIRTREYGYYENIEENLRNRFTGWRLAERLVWLDELKAKDKVAV